MKKSLAYVTIAVLLGAALMFVPFWVFPVRIKTDTHTEQLSPRSFTHENLKALSAESETSAGVMPRYPTDAISVGLMLILSLILALIISLAAKGK